MDIVKICKQLGASDVVEVPVKKIVLQPEIRGLCEQNTCGRINTNYTCPPHVGKIEDLIAELSSFSTVVIWQNIYSVEDSFDYDGMMEGQAKHHRMTLEVARQVYNELGRKKAIVLTAGGCFLCKQCAVVSNTPCKNPNKALISLEAYGVNVVETSMNIGMKYINGKDTVTYFSGVFIK